MRVLLRVQSDPLIALGDLFETRIVPGRPAWTSVGFSLAFHCAVAFCLATIHFPPSPQRLEKQYPPTQVRIGDKLYYVARLLPRQPAPTPLRSPGASPRAAPAAPTKRPAARAFVPPEIKRDPVAEQILIQPASPLEIQPPPLTLPSFRAWTAQMPKIPKQFVAPGREVKPIPQAEPLLSPPNVSLVAANPVPPKTNPALTVPLPPPPIEIPDLPVNTSLAVAAGDPINVIAVTRNPAFPVLSLVVPAGNVGTGAAGDGTNPAIGSANPGGTGGRGASAGSGTSTANESGAAAAGSGTGASSAPAVKTVVITRPANGGFDAVVVQSSPLDLLPNRRDLLSGRPIYTVYLALGTAKEWTFYFCIPQDAAAQAAQPLVVSAGPAAPVIAPYPLRMIRPLVAMPASQKYLLVHGFVTGAGRVERLRVIDAGSEQIDDAVLGSLIGWEFRPATRDGQPTRVEFLLAIPQAGLGL